MSDQPDRGAPWIGSTSGNSAADVPPTIHAAPSGAMHRDRGAVAPVPTRDAESTPCPPGSRCATKAVESVARKGSGDGGRAPGRSVEVVVPPIQAVPSGAEARRGDDSWPAPP